MSRRNEGAKAGFAAPLAVVLLIAIALLALLIIEGALAELRASAASYSESRLVAAAESALADVLARRLDTTVLALPPAATVFETVSSSSDSVVTRAEIVSPGIARVVIEARTRNPRLRLFAGISALLALRASPTVTGEVVLSPLADNWWVARP